MRMVQFKLFSVILLLALLLPLGAYAEKYSHTDNAKVARVIAEIVAVDNVRASDKRFYYRFKLKYPDKSISYGFIPVKRLELWSSDLNNIVGLQLEFTPADAPTPELAKIGCSVVNPKVIY